MDPSYYDEFGNYIGPDMDEEEEDVEEEDLNGIGFQEQIYGVDQGVEEMGGDQMDEDMQEQRGMQMMRMDVDDIPRNQIVLHEDKKYYPSAEEVYGTEVETLVQEEDTQPLSEPIIAPVKTKKWVLEVDKEKEEIEFSWKTEFQISLLSQPHDLRNIAIVGHLHHGKTSLIDMLLSQVSSVNFDSEKNKRYLDTHKLERERGLSLKSNAISLLGRRLNGKSFVCHWGDTPGHSSCLDEATSITRLADGAVVVVDAVEGVMVSAERMIKHLVLENIPFVLMLNKIDRLAMELKIPPNDAYFKLRNVIEEVNTIVASCTSAEKADQLRVSPERGNVCFASTFFGWSFTLKSFSKLYRESTGADFDIPTFAARLWGDVFLDPETQKFVRSAPTSSSQRTFVHFILNPIYKIYSSVISLPPSELKPVLSKLGITLKPAAYKMDVKPLLHLVLSTFFGPADGLHDMIYEHLPSPLDGASSFLTKYYTGPISPSPIVNSLSACDSDGPLAIHVTKLYPSADSSSFFALGRILSGTLKQGEKVRVLGENYTPEDEEDMTVQVVENIYIPMGRSRISVDQVGAGNWVLMTGVDANIVKTGTIYGFSPNGEEEDSYIFRAITHVTQSVLKVAVEPVNPSELPKMLDGLRKVNKTYVAAVTKVEESGEHIILGTAELYLDCLLHDLRRLYSEIEIKVSDPVVKFCETVVETSAVKCWAESPNKKNKLTFIAQPLDSQIASDIESRKFVSMSNKQIATHFQDSYGWDILAARSIWAFGPEENGPNILLDDTLPGEVDKKLLKSVKESIKQGFLWGTREGPLCDEPIRNVQFKILDASIASEPILRGGGQIIPTARRVCYSSFLMATPRLMEPIYYCEIQSPADCVSAVYTVLARRRGHVTQDVPKPGSPLYTVKAYIPVIDSAGFETDLRTHTQGQAFVQMMFDHWQIVPGDPLDKSIVLRPLEPSPAQHLARDFMIKTRRRKGLSEDVSIAKFFDDPMLLELAKNDVLGIGGLL
ncbi:P-loop containing nucleoside triphosphate hydrolase protein [Paraphysoderma sedebokerense]|nr:P-loop containing nucleoside triphosphate hydrolase protein [Paraphysoderma sedebokerense]